MPKAFPTLHRQPSGRFIETTFLSLYILCVVLGASFYFSFSFVLFVCWSWTLLDPFYLVWKRDTLRFFIRILLCFAYILLSILSSCFYYQLLCFAYIFLRAVRCCYYTLFCFTYICLESCLWLLAWFVGMIKMLCMW